MIAKLHDGHRNRMRDRVAKSGFDSLGDHEKLEVFLYSFIPRKNTNDIAHLLMERCGSLDKVFSADRDTLLSVKGMTAKAADAIAAISHYSLLYRAAKSAEKPKLCTQTAFGEEAESFFGGNPSAYMACFCLDNKQKVKVTLSYPEDGLPLPRQLAADIVGKDTFYTLIAFRDTRLVNDDNLLTAFTKTLYAVDANLEDVLFFDGEKRIFLRNLGRLPSPELKQKAAADSLVNVGSIFGD